MMTTSVRGEDPPTKSKFPPWCIRRDAEKEPQTHKALWEH